MRTVNNTILILPIDTLTSYKHLRSAIYESTKHTKHRILILLVSPLFHPQNTGLTRPRSWDPLQNLFSFIYSTASFAASEQDRILLRIDVLLHADNQTLVSAVESDELKSTKWDVFYTPPTFNVTRIPTWIRKYPRSEIDVDETRGDHQQDDPAPASNGGGGDGERSNTDSNIDYPVAAMGGTFDHLHAGHKILLSMGAWIASEKLIVGVTDDSLLVNKAYREALESIQDRIAAVKAFLRLFKPDLKYEIVPINDVYGPTAWDANIQVLVVSKETVAGAKSIDKLRGEKGLPSLQTFVIDVISGDSGADLSSEENAEVLKTAKMGSTYIRRWLVEGHR